jgi:hypothetical protein
MTGIMLMVTPDAAVTGPDTMEYHAAERVLTGTACGFTIIDLDEHLDKVHRHYDTTELGLIETLKERAYGRFAVCHLVGYQTGTWEPPSDLYTKQMAYRAAGPISSNYLHIPGAVNSITYLDRHDEVAKILDTMPKDIQRLLTYVCQQIVECDDPMEAITKQGRKIREIYTRANAIDRKSLNHLFSFYITQALGEKVYEFEGLPVSIVPIDQGAGMGNFYFYPDDARMTVHVEGVVYAQRFFANNDGDVRISPAEQILLLQSSVVDQFGTESTAMIPIEELRGYSYREVSIVDSDVAD